MDDIPTVSLRLIVNVDRKANGWPLDAVEIEQFWLPVLGPTCTALLRWCARHRDQLTRFHTIEAAELAAQLGLGHGHGRNSPLGRTLHRLTRYDAARPEALIGSLWPAYSIHSHPHPPSPALVAHLSNRLAGDRPTAGARRPVA